MNSRTRRIVRNAGLVVAAGFFAMSVSLALQVGAANKPGEKDVKKAARILSPDAYTAGVSVAGDVVGGNAIMEPDGREVGLSPAVPGIVARILVKEGQRVEKGAELLVLEDSVERAALAAAQADHEAAQSRSELSGANAARMEKLVKGGAATAEERDAKVFQAAIDRSAVKQAQARVTQARAALDQKTIRAPRGGEILQIVAREGEYYNPQGGAVSLRMGDTTKLNARMDVDERDVARIRIGEPAWVIAESFGDRKFPGKVVEIARRMGRKNIRTDDPTEKIDTKILEIVIELEAGRDLIPGERVKAFVKSPAS